LVNIDHALHFPSWVAGLERNNAAEGAKMGLITSTPFINSCNAYLPQPASTAFNGVALGGANQVSHTLLIAPSDSVILRVTQL
jgi:hypothetical protein